MAETKTNSGTLRFAKVVGHARPPETLNAGDPGITIFSAENFKLESGETHAYRTGILLEIPDGCIGRLHENAGMGVKGVTVAGGLLTPNDIGEVRVSLLNNHREAFEVRSGDPLCLLCIEEAPATQGDGLGIEAEEYDLEGLAGEMKDRADENRQKTLKAKADKKAKDAAALADATAKRDAKATK